MGIISRDNTKKKDIVKNIYNNIGIPNVYAAKILGTFFFKKKDKRPGRNPKNLKYYEILERNLVTFKTSENLKKKINLNVKK